MTVEKRPPMPGIWPPGSRGKVSHGSLPSHGTPPCRALALDPGQVDGPRGRKLGRVRPWRHRDEAMRRGGGPRGGPPQRRAGGHRGGGPDDLPAPPPRRRAADPAGVGQRRLAHVDGRRGAGGGGGRAHRRQAPYEHRLPHDGRPRRRGTPVRGAIARMRERRRVPPRARGPAATGQPARRAGADRRRPGGEGRTYGLDQLAVALVVVPSAIVSVAAGVAPAEKLCSTWRPEAVAPSENAQSSRKMRWSPPRAPAVNRHAPLAVCVAAIAARSCRYTVTTSCHVAGLPLASLALSRTV